MQGWKRHPNLLRGILGQPKSLLGEGGGVSNPGIMWYNVGMIHS